MAETVKIKAPLAFLQSLVDSDTTPAAMRLEAAKALLPYTARKTPESLETFNRTFSVTDDRLKGMTTDELGTLLTLLRKLTDTGVDRSGIEETEVQPS